MADNKVRVVFIIESFVLGGAEKVLVDIANNLDPSSFDVSVCRLFKKSIYKSYCEEIVNPFKQHVHYRYLINNRWRCLYLLFNYLLRRYPSFLYRLLVGDQYDTVVAFYEGAPTHFVAKVKLKHGRKIAWLHTATSLSQRGKTHIELLKEEQYYQCFNQIVAVSQGVADSFNELFPSLRSLVCIRYNPVNSEEVLEKSLERIELKKPNCPLFVSVGRMAPVKGYDRYLRVINSLYTQGYSFEVWIIGGGNRFIYEHYCQENHIDNVRFLGNQKNPYPYMKMADWLIVPSYVEGLSTVVLEGISLGKAILATNCPGMIELLGDRELGLVVGNSEESLYDGVKTLLDGYKITSDLSTSSMHKRRELLNFLNSIKKISEVLYVH